MPYTIIEIQDILKEKQKPGRFVHTLGVQYTSACLAMRWGADVEQAQMAGLLHDCAKHMKPEKLLEKSRHYGLNISGAQKRNPFLLHGQVGACIARDKYQITDEAVLGAIRWHTTGRPEMTLLEKIVFTADYIEPNRNKAPNLAQLRQMSFENLDLAVYEILQQTLDYLKDGAQEIDETTELTLQYYKKLLKL